MPGELTRLLETESAWLHRLARSLLGRDRGAEDLAQDALTLALTKQPQFESDPRRVRGWLRQVIERLVRSELRQRNTHARQLAKIPPTENFETNANERLEIRDLLMDEVRALAEPYRSTIVMSFLEGLSTREIAERKDVAEAVVRQHKSRALRQLRDRLGERFDEPQEWRVMLALVLSPAGLPSAPKSTSALILVWSWLMGSKYIYTGAALALCLLIASSFGMLGTDPYLRTETGDPTPKTSASTPAQVEAQREELTPTQPAVTTSSESPGIAFEILDMHQRPLKGVDVFIWQDRESSLHATTDALGNASFPSMKGKGSYCILADARQPIYLEGHDLNGSHRIVFKDKLSLRGIITIDGRPPNFPVDLHLRDKTQARPPIPDKLRLWYIQRGIHTGIGGSLTMANRDGTFQFSGLQANWRGSLGWHAQFCLASPGGLFQRYAIQVDVNQGFIHLDLQGLPTVRGKLIWDDDGSPIAGAKVYCTIRLEGSNDDTSMGSRTTSTGAFVFAAFDANQTVTFTSPNLRPAITRFSLSGKVKGKRMAWDFDRDQLEAADVLTIRVPRIKSSLLPIRIVDELGKPIHGGLLYGDKLSEPTDANGRTSIELLDGEPRTWIVGAKGYSIRQVTIPEEPATDEWTLELAPGNHLLVRVRHADGTAMTNDEPHDMRITLLYRNNPFDHGKRGYPTPLHRQLGNLQRPSSIGGTRKGVTYRNYLPSNQGEVLFLSLNPATDMIVEVRDILGHAAIAQPIKGIGNSERRSMDLLLPGPGQQMSVRISDLDGVPLTSARAFLHGPKSGTRIEVSDTGEVILPRIYTAPDAWHIEVSCDGYLDQVVHPGSEESVQVRLVRGTAFEVQVFDTDQEPAKFTALKLYYEGIEYKGKTEKTGQYNFACIPKGPVKLFITIGGDVFEHTKDSSSGAAKIIVPRNGSLFVKTASPANQEQSFTVYLDPIEGQCEARKPVKVNLRRHGKELIGKSLALPGRYHVRTDAQLQIAAGTEVTVAPGLNTELNVPRTR